MRQEAIDAWNPCLDTRVCGNAPDRKVDANKGLENTTLKKANVVATAPMSCLFLLRAREKQDQRHQR